MNKEVVKAMNKKEKKYPIRKWWNENGYKIMRVLFFPIWIAIIMKEKINKYLNSREAWNEERAQSILEYYVPRKAHWVDKDKTFYFFDNGYGWSMCYSKRYLKRKDRRFWKINAGWVGGEIRSYLINKFELEGFTKEVGSCYDGHTEIAFRMNKN